MVRENLGCGVGVEAGLAKLDAFEPEVCLSPFRSTSSLIKEFAEQEHGQTSSVRATSSCDSRFTVCWGQTSVLHPRACRVASPGLLAKALATFPLFMTLLKDICY